MRRNCAAVCGMRTDMMASQALAEAIRCETGQMPQMRAVEAGHLVKRTALGESLESAHLGYMKMRVFNLTLRIQLDGDLAVSFEAGYRVDRDGLCHNSNSFGDQAPKRVSAGMSSGSPVISAVSAVWNVSAEGGQPGKKTSTFTNS